MTEKIRIPVDAEVAVHSARWIIQSRAGKGDPWCIENDNTPGLPGGFEEGARKLLGICRTANSDRESCMVRRTVVCYDEPMEN